MTADYLSHVPVFRSKTERPTGGQSSSDDPYAEMTQVLEGFSNRQSGQVNAEPPPITSEADFGLPSEGTAERVEEPAAISITWPPLTIEHWLARDLPDPDCIMGNWLTTTSRTLLVAPTGLGKTNFAMAVAMHATAGKDFLHWRAHRPCKGLYIDGEMSRRLFKQRMANEVQRLGEKPAGFYALNHEDIEGFAPLNTPAGQDCMNRLIEHISDVDFIVFDSIMCLTHGDMKDGEPWAQTMPWVRSLTKRNIGQLWVHHTGHDTSRSYGDKTKEWQLDTVLHMDAVENAETDVSFSLEFRKARERTPATRADFQTTRIALIGDSWRSEATTTAHRGHVSPLGLKFLGALQNVLAEGGALRDGRRSTSLDIWRGECARMGLIDARQSTKCTVPFLKVSPRTDRRKLCHLRQRLCLACALKTMVSTPFRNRAETMQRRKAKPCGNLLKPMRNHRKPFPNHQANRETISYVEEEMVSPLARGHNSQPLNSRTGLAFAFGFARRALLR